jgi:Yip1 domain
MSTAHLFADTLLAPGRGLATAAARRSFVPPVLAATAAALLAASVLAPRVDYQRSVEEQLAQHPEAAAQMSPHDRELALAQAQKLGALSTYAQGLFGPALRTAAVAFCLLVAFRLASRPVPFAPTFAVTAWATLPLALKDLLSVPALWRMRGVSLQEAERALPSSLAALLPDGARPQLVAAAGAVDLFALWALVLVALGMAEVAQVDRRRSFAVVVVLWASFVLLQRVAAPGLAGGR